MSTNTRARVTLKGQITIPRAVRDALGLEASSVVEFEIRDGEVVLRKASSFLDHYGTVTPRNRPEDRAEVRRETAEWVARRALERGRITLPD